MCIASKKRRPISNLHGEVYFSLLSFFPCIKKETLRKLNPMKIKFFVLGILVLLSGCAVRRFELPFPKMYRGPEVRVGLLKGKTAIEFSPMGKCEILAGTELLAKGNSGEIWIIGVKESKPGKEVFRLVAGSMSSRDRAREKAREVEALGFKTMIKPIGMTSFPLQTGVSPTLFYRVYLADIFETDSSARTFREQLKNSLETFIVREMVKPPSGQFILKNVTKNLQYESPVPLHILGAPIQIKDITVGTGFHWEKWEDRIYPPVIEFTLDMQGKLSAVNVVPLELYVEGVLPYEMPSGFPESALRAQAVCIRSKALALKGLVHSEDPFDFCGEVHCQVYGGLDRRNFLVSRAVRKTQGEVLVSEGRIVDALFSAVCGGHTENVEEIWNTSPKAHLKARVDGPFSLKRYEPLDQEENVRKWILESPQAYCNTRNGEWPTAFAYTQKYFRWEVRISQEELRAQLEKSSGKSLGAIREMVSLKRTKSGRITKLKIVGTERDTVLEGELVIRKALSPNTLWSSCFIVIPQEASEIPQAFILKGAGWGHGVGMCQTGAGILAFCGKTYKKILKFYFPNVEIKKVY